MSYIVKRVFGRKIDYLCGWDTDASAQYTMSLWDALRFSDLTAAQDEASRAEGQIKAGASKAARDIALSPIKVCFPSDVEETRVHKII